ncbi:MAG: outer membrane beta-barrel protein [Comamonadaceae bacterium]|nr:outer membrane beta-barrel protein [Comamonadaceae bacterium]
MTNATKATVAVLFLALTATVAQAAETSITLKGGYFAPSDAVFRDVYGGGLTYGVELAVPIAGVLRAWAGAEIFSKRGLTTESEETTKVTVVPLFAGLRCQFGGKSVRPYLGAAAAYFPFKENNPLGTASESGLGVLGQAGLIIGLGKSFGLDVHGGYRACTLTAGDEEDPIEASLGGLSAGLGLVIRF